MKVAAEIKNKIECSLFEDMGKHTTYAREFARDLLLKRLTQASDNEAVCEAGFTCKG